MIILRKVLNWMNSGAKNDENKADLSDLTQILPIIVKQYTGKQATIMIVKEMFRQRVYRGIFKQMVMGADASVYFGLGLVFKHGGDKYGWDNWCQIEDAENRYWKAFLRHYKAHFTGEELDKESGLPHYHHALANLVFCEKIRDKKEIE